MNPTIVSCTVTGPGMKAKPMATYLSPAQLARRQQREVRDYALSISARDRRLTPPVERQPPAPEVPATVPVWQQTEPDPVLTREFLAGMALGALLTSAAVALIWGVRS